MNVGDINIDSLLRAFQNFEEFQHHLTTKQERAGDIQAFEYTYELT